jgi:uncharacterized protein involved in response to NO
MAFLDLGFRPFFLLGGSYAVVCVVTLVAALALGVWPDQMGLPSVAWHGHEMLYGFVVAAIAGFLLTAVPNWTATPPIAGPRLAGLVLIWLGGRVALSPLVSLSGWPPVCVDLAFVPILAAMLVPPLIRAQNRRNIGFVILLALLFLGNVLFHNRQQQLFDAGSLDGLRLAIDTVLLLIVVVAGRIVPAFTRNALVRSGTAHAIVSTPYLNGLSIAAIALVLASDLIAPNSAFAAIAAGAAALINLTRLTRWEGWKAIGEPIVWVLHLGYAWLVAALALKALWLGFAIPLAAFWLHALTAGAFGTMILGVMSRVALGHTGRPLKVRPSIVAAYAMISIGTVLRVFVAALTPVHYMTWVAMGGLLWAAAFLVFVAVYAPALVGTRVN